MKWVDERQKRRPLGRPSGLDKIVEPVVVYPETDSNNAFISVNSPPHNRNGNIPNKQERTQERMVIVKPSFKLTVSDLRTNIKGKLPTASVIKALIRRGEKEASKP